MLQKEEGPFAIFARLQAWAASRPDRVGGINHGYFCFYCLSIWVSIPASFLIANSIYDFLLLLLSISAGAVFLENISDKITKEQ